MYYFSTDLGGTGHEMDNWTKSGNIIFHYNARYYIDECNVN